MEDRKQKRQDSDVTEALYFRAVTFLLGFEKLFSPTSPARHCEIFR